MYNIAFRVDGGVKIGLGHLMRCISLAIALDELNVNVYFISNEEHEVIIKNGFNIVKIPSDNDLMVGDNGIQDLCYELDNLIKILDEHRTDCLILDHYNASNAYFKKLHDHVKLLVYIDDSCKDLHFVDVIINGNIYANGCYENLNEYTKYLLGNKYALFRKHFIGIPDRIINKKPRRIMITTGGSDNHHLTIRLLKILTNIERLKNYNIIIVIGALFIDVKEIEDFSSNFKNIKLFYNVSNMAEMMLKSDLALTASGLTLYELAITGTPSISFIIVDNQERVGKLMNDLKCTINLGWHDKVFDNEIVEKTLELLNNYKLRRNLSETGQGLFDGRGPYRCAKTIIESLNTE